MEFLYTDYDLTLQKIMGSDSEMEYISKERNLIPSMINKIYTELTGDILNSVFYASNILVRKSTVDSFESLGYNLFKQFESESSFEYFLRPFSKKCQYMVKDTLEFAIVTTLKYCVLDINYSQIRPSITTRPSVLMDSTDIVQPLDASFPETGRNRFDNSSFQLEDFSESSLKQIIDSHSFKRQNSYDCAENRKRQKSEYLELSSILCRTQDSNGFIESIEITKDDQRPKGPPPVDLSLIWNRKYCSSDRHVAFKLDHPLHYKREYDRIRQSPLSVFDSLMSRQTNGPLSQRKVLEVVARPHYDIYPPTNVEEIVRFNQSSDSNSLLPLEEHIFLNLESFRTFDCYFLP